MRSIGFSEIRKRDMENLIKDIVELPEIMAVAIVGSGLDICYPKAHDTLFEKIQQYGFVMSEYPPGTPPLACHFPKRNQIIAAMSDELYVIDPGRNSGSLITADFFDKQKTPRQITGG